MSFDTRQNALLSWVPEKSVTLYDYESTVVYLYEGRLVILRVFSLANTWHVSVDVDKSIDDLERIMS